MLNLIVTSYSLHRLLTYTPNSCSSRSQYLTLGFRQLHGGVLRNSLACEIDMPGTVCGFGESSTVQLGKRIASPKRGSILL